MESTYPRPGTGQKPMKVLDWVKDLLLPDSYDPDREDPTIQKGRETIQATRSERERLRGTLEGKPETGFFLGDALLVRRKPEGHEPDVPNRL